MRDAPHVPQLREDAPARRMHSLGDATPACHLRGRVHAGRPGVALPLRADLRAFADDQARSRTLGVVLSHQRSRHVACTRP